MSTRIARRDRRLISATRAVASPLEPRLLLATINWVNDNVNDNFDIYGASAGVARMIVRRAITDWVGLISHFHQANPGPETNTVNLSIFGGDLGGNTLGQTTPNVVGPDQTPRAANITMDRDAAGNNWFFDSSPTTDSEFGTVQGPFARSTGSIATTDFYSVIAHEIGHALGFSNQPGQALAGQLTSTGQADPGQGGESLLLFNGNGYTATFTTNGGGHLYDGAPVAGLPTHNWRLMNPGIGTGQRVRISDFELRILRDAYGYELAVNTFTMPNNVASVSGGILRIQGTPNPDRIEISRPGSNVRVFINSSEFDFAAAGITGISITGGDGNDTVTLLSDDKPTTVLGEGGEDETFLAGPGTADLDLISGAVVVNGGTGVDTVVMRDSGNTQADTYSISNTQVTRPFFGGLSYSQLEQIQLEGQQGDNVFSINSAAINVRYNLYGSNGNDQFYVGGVGGTDIDAGLPAGTVAGRDLFLSGSGGSDSIFYGDTGETSADMWLVNGDVAQNYDPAATVPTSIKVVNDLSHEFMTFQGSGSVGTFVRADWTPTGISSVFNMNGGNDEVWLGWNGGNLADIHGPVTVNGGTGTDTVQAVDDFQFDNATFTINSGSIGHAGAASISHTSIQSLTLHTGSGNDTVLVQSLTADQSFTANGNDGGDALWIANNTGDVANVPALVTFNGGSGIDQAYFDDDDHSATAGYTIGSTQVSRGAGAALNYLDVSAINIFAPHGANLFTVNAAAATTDYFIYSNGGDDTVAAGGGDVEATIAVGSHVNFFGQGGNDVVAFDNSTDPTAGGQLRILSDQAFATDPLGAATSGVVHFESHERVNYLGSGVRNVVSLAATAIGVPADVSLGGGDDLLIVAFDVLAGLAALGGNVTVHGGGGEDFVDVWEHALTSGVQYDLNTSQVGRVGVPSIDWSDGMEGATIRAGTGDDRLYVDSLRADQRMSLLGNDGADQFWFANLSGNMNNTLGAATIDGGNGADMAFLDDDNHGLHVSYTFNPVSFSRSNSINVTHSAVESRFAFASQGSNNFTVNGIAAGQTLDIFANGGDDTVKLGGGDVDSNMLGTLNFDGGPSAVGADVVQVDDVNDSLADFGANDYRPLGSEFRKVLADGSTRTHGPINLAAHENLVIDVANSGGDVKIGASVIPIFITGGSGSEGVYLGFGTNQLGSISQAVSYIGNGGLGYIRLSDSATASGQTYDLFSGFIGRAGGTFGGISHSGSMNIDLFATNQPDTINVNANDDGLTLHGNGGADAFNVGGGNWDTNILLGVSVNGGFDGAIDTLTINDSADTGNDAYNVVNFDATNDSMSKPHLGGTRSIGYGGGLDAVVLQANSGSNAIALDSVHVGLSFTANGNAGGDVVTIGQTPIAPTKVLGPVTVNGNAGDDEVRIVSTQQPVTFDGGANNDGLFVSQAAQNLNNVPTTITFDGGADTDAASVFDTNAADGNFDMTGSQIDLSAPLRPFILNHTGAESINFFQGGASASAAIASTNVGTLYRLYGSLQGDSVFLIDNLAAHLGTLNLDGRDWRNEIHIRDGAAATGDGYTLTTTNAASGTGEILRNGMAAPIGFTGFAKFTIGTGGGNDTINVVGLPTYGAVFEPGYGRRLLIDTGTGSDTVNTFDTGTIPIVIATGSAADDTINVNAPGLGISLLRFDDALPGVKLAALTVGNGATAELGASPTSRIETRSLSIGTINARLDLRSGSLVIDYTGATPATTIRNALIAGRNGGGWNGSRGIVSSVAAATPGTAVGYGEASQFFTTPNGTVGGIGVDDTSLVLRFTRVGDATLDRLVGFDDLLVVAQNYGATTGRTWAAGDFDYSGGTVFDDLLLLAQQYGNGVALVAPIAANDAIAAVLPGSRRRREVLASRA